MSRARRPLHLVRSRTTFGHFFGHHPQRDSRVGAQTMRRISRVDTQREALEKENARINGGRQALIRLDFTAV
ncbi:hypothetical protein H6P81_018915 [Aristolochia fimbriata]|uniref:Uncharacterized protein n=1 Tax=Aristolochia fimbriata TaxID=158543 RepID=A0AAV7E3W5_ARIFI|nr:hypothetical protein H6P81_018915 [Aristolochia fimbriata]